MLILYVCLTAKQDDLVDQLIEGRGHHNSSEAVFDAMRVSLKLHQDTLKLTEWEAQTEQGNTRHLRTRFKQSPCDN